MSAKTLAANLMLSTVMLTAVLPAIAVTADTSTPANGNTVKPLTSEQVTSQAAQQQMSSSTTQISQAKNDKIQTLTAQTMILKKIVVSDSKQKNQAGAIGISQDNLRGVNGSTFKVYDVTALMNTIISEKLKTNSQVKATAGEIDQAVQKQTTTSSSQATNAESSSVTSSISQSTNESSITSSTLSQAASDNSSKQAMDQELNKQVNDLMQGETLQQTIATRADKLNSSQLKPIATVTTAHDAKLKSDGVAQVKLPIDGKYHAYYIVNTATPKALSVTNAAPIVVLTPVTQADGLYTDSFTIYPKSDTIPKASKPAQPAKQISQVRLYQTGKTKQHNWFSAVKEMILNLIN